MSRNRAKATRSPRSNTGGLNATNATGGLCQGSGWLVELRGIPADRPWLRCSVCGQSVSFTRSKCGDHGKLKGHPPKLDFSQPLRPNKPQRPTEA